MQEGFTIASLTLSTVSMVAKIFLHWRYYHEIIETHGSYNYAFSQTPITRESLQNRKRGKYNSATDSQLLMMEMFSPFYKKQGTLNPSPKEKLIEKQITVSLIILYISTITFFILTS